MILCKNKLGTDVPRCSTGNWCSVRRAMGAKRSQQKVYTDVFKR